MKKYFGEVVDKKMVLNKYGNLVRYEWLQTQKIRKNIIIDEFVIMPNHMHGILIINNVGAIRRIAPTNMTLQPNSLGSVIGQFKSITTKQIHLIDLKIFEWQRSFYDHIIRNEKSLFAIRNYIKYNPSKWSDDQYNKEDYFI